MKSRMLAMVVLSLVLAAVAYAKPKVLYIDSYHQGYAWSDGITEGITKTLGVKLDKEGKVDDSSSPYEFKIFRMHTKLFEGMKVKENATVEEIKAAQDEYKKQVALKAKDLIDSWKPDVVIASDDNASKFLIKPYYKNSDVPFVFCGLNWDASVYGFPCKNVTGMVEVALVPPLIDNLKKYSKGDKIGLLACDNVSSRKDADLIIKNFKLDIDCHYVMNYQQWKDQFVQMQKSEDMMIVFIAGVKDFDLDDARKFVRENTTIPVGCLQETESTLSLIAYAKIPQEQGAWAANAAKQILSGTSPADIKVAKNKEGKLMLNIAVAKKLGITFPMNMVKHATIIKE